MNTKMIFSRHDRDEGILKKMVDSLPYPAHLFRADGILVHTNQRFLESWKMDAAWFVANVINIYNIKTEPSAARWGLGEHITAAFHGETAYSLNVPLPVKELSERFQVNKELSFEDISHDITSFPIFDAAGIFRYVIMMFIVRKRDKLQIDAIKAKEYIDSHLTEPFDSTKVAKSVSYSRPQFFRMFKKYTGFTPHGYYCYARMKLLAEKLDGSGRSIVDIFEECGLKYNSHTVELFKKHTGMTPSAYRWRNR